jgi:anaerobic magnesium-protoporphyrin IX monomethyl ester cyclase
MKIFLVQAYLGRREAPIFPLGLAYLASNLINHDVKVFDPNVADDPYGELAKQVKGFNPEVIGISLRNIDTTQYGDPYYYFKTVQPTIDLLKGINQKATLVIGGSAFSIFAEKIMERIPEIDFGVYLDGEESFPELLDNLKSPEAVKGIYYRENGMVKFTGYRQTTDFIWSLKPKWDLFELYRYNGPESMGVLS